MTAKPKCTARTIGSPRWAIIASSVVVLLWTHAQPVRADMVLVAQSGLVMGTLSESIPLSAPSAGTVDVTLSDLAWPTKLSSLSFSATTATGVLASGSLPESSSNYQTTFSVTGPVAFYVHITAAAQSLGLTGLPSLGLYAEQIGFTPQGVPVPLPASGWLLLVGIGAAVAAVRGRGAAGAGAVTAEP